jgi:hypothetical protein
MYKIIPLNEAVNNVKITFLKTPGELLEYKPGLCITRCFSTIALALKGVVAFELAFHNISSGKGPGSTRITSFY